MPLYIPVNNAAALSTNQSGRLADDQIASIHLLCRRRGQVGLIIFCSALFMAVIAGLAFILPPSPGETVNQGVKIITGVMTVIAALDAAWGWWIFRAAKKAKATIGLATPVQIAVGRPDKYNYGTPIQYGGATHAVVLRQGWLRMDGISYGVIPGDLYQTISDQVEGTLYFIDLHVPSFKKRLAVNYRQYEI